MLQHFESRDFICFGEKKSNWVKQKKNPKWLSCGLLLLRVSKLSGVYTKPPRWWCVSAETWHSLRNTHRNGHEWNINSPRLDPFFPCRDSKEVPTISAPVLCVPLSFRCIWTLPVLWLRFLFKVQLSVPAALWLIFCERALWILKSSLCSFWSGQQWWPNSGGGQALLSKHKAASWFPDWVTNRLSEHFFKLKNVEDTRKVLSGDFSHVTLIVWGSSLVFYKTLSYLHLGWIQGAETWFGFKSFWLMWAAVQTLRNFTYKL